MPLRLEDISSLSEAVKDVLAYSADFGVSFGTNNTIFKFRWWPKDRAAWTSASGGVCGRTAIFLKFGKAEGLHLGSRQGQA